MTGGELRTVTELSSEVQDEPSFISRDGCRLYFQSTKDSPKLRIYVAERGL